VEGNFCNIFVTKSLLSHPRIMYRAGMNKQPPNVEWTIIENDAEWARLQGPPLPDSVPVASRRPLQRYLWRVAALLLLMATGGSAWWRPDQTTLSPPAASGAAPSQPVLGAIAQDRGRGDDSLPNDQWEQEWLRQFGHAYRGRRPASHSNEPDAYEDIIRGRLAGAPGDALWRFFVIL
jgi:hypothetical protein